MWSAISNRSRCSRTRRYCSWERKICQRTASRSWLAGSRRIPTRHRWARPGWAVPAICSRCCCKKKTGTRFNLVPYRGVNPSVQDLIAGQIDMTISNTATAMPHVRADRVKAFAVTTKDRIAIAPEIPSAEEAGFPWFQFSLWAGLFAPKVTPRDIIHKLNAAAVGTTHDPATRQKLVDQGFVIPPRERQTPDALGAYQKAEIAKWWPIIKAAGTKAE